MSGEPHLEDLTTLEKMPNLTLEEAVEFAKKNIKKLPENMLGSEITSDMLSCIDDRKSDGELKLRIPGAGLGVLMDVLGAKFDFSPEEVEDVVEQALGQKLSYHTDDAHIRDPLKCAGCGHCAGALAKPDEYRLTPEAVEFLEKTYLPNLDKKGSEPEVYSGEHSARAVMIIKGPITLTSDTDTHVYVYHPELHKKIIEKIAGLIAEKYELNAREISDRIWNSAQERLGHTVHHLAEHLPKFEISQDENGEATVVAL